MRGAFYFPESDIEVPNTLTKWGLSAILRAATTQEIIVLAFGVTDQRFRPDIELSDVKANPVFYTQPIKILPENTSFGWLEPVIVGNDVYAETTDVTISKLPNPAVALPITRLYAWVGIGPELEEKVFCISAPLPNAPILLTTANVNFRYRVYGR